MIEPDDNCGEIGGIFFSIFESGYHVLHYVKN